MTGLATTGPAATAPVPRNPWLLRPAAPGFARRLFCFPYSGCGASMYHQWPVSLGVTEICPVQLPGRENRFTEPIPTSYGELAAAVVAGLAPVLDRPAALFGHCGSALIAYEVAAQLAAAGRPAATVFISSQVAPQDGPHGRFLTMSDDELRHELAELSRRFGARPNPAMTEVSLRILRQDLACNQTYRSSADTTVDARLVLVGWRDDTDVPPALMSGWSTRGPVTRHELDGDHFDFMSAPPQLLATLLQELSVPDRPDPKDAP